MTQQRIVVGAGVVGVACAHYLREAGADVVLIDKGKVGGGCSHGNCGYVCPSHVLPLAGPGVIGRTLKTLMQKDSPLAIRFRLDPSLWSWLIRFGLRCRAGAMHESAAAVGAMLNSSRSLYGELMRSRTLEAEWQERGLLFVFRTPHEMGHYAATDRMLGDRYDMPAKPYVGEQVTKLEPALKSGLAGGWHYELDAHLRPDTLMRSWRELVERRGVEVREDCALTDIERSGRRAKAVVTTQGRIPADRVVVATGAWTPRLGGVLRTSLPIQPGKGYSITMARPSVCPRIPLIFEEDRVAVTPFNEGYRIGSTMEFGGYDETTNPARLEILRRAARVYLREPEAEPVQETWWGWRPMVADGKPIIGPLPKWDNVSVATGHGMLGLSMATGTGKLVAEMLTGVVPHLDPGPYAATRF